MLGGIFPCSRIAAIGSIVWNVEAVSGSSITRHYKEGIMRHMGWLDMAWARAVQGQKRFHDASGRVTGRAKPDSLVVLLVMWKEEQKCKGHFLSWECPCQRLVRNKPCRSHALPNSPNSPVPGWKCQEERGHLQKTRWTLHEASVWTSVYLRHPPTFPKFQPLFQLFLYCFCIVSVSASVVSVFSAGLALSQGRPIEDRLLSKGAAFCSEAFNLGHNLGQLLYCRL